jgi:hypothetical protein
MVTDSAIVNISINLVTFTIKDPPLRTHSIHTSVDHFTTLFHTVFIFSHKSIIFSVLLAGVITCHNKSLAAFENHPNKKGNERKVISQYIIRILKLLIIIYVKSD